MDGQKVQHLIVLMLENRSFDHLLGYLDYPPEVSFEGLRGREEAHSNPLADGRLAYPGSNAGYWIDPGPDHSHASVMAQLLGSNPRTYPFQLTNAGFAANYEAIHSNQPDLALQCFTPDCLPVLAVLARKFAVCDHWFCSVPGATWPNRNFAIAATSDGEVDIHLRAYHNKTIFEQLSQANRDWAIYYSGFPPQSLAFTRLWSSPSRNWLQRFKPIKYLYRAIQNDRLPDFALVEPDMLGKVSDSQHPGMGGEMDFRAGERLIWRIYATLRGNMAVFNKTLLLITYDEHGGFFDHVPPPQGPEWSVGEVHQDDRTGYTFNFDLLGPRVPAVLVSPWISEGTVDQTVYDHASIPATVRKIFQIPEALTPRDRHANTFESVLNRSVPRKRLPWIREPFVDEAARNLIAGLELRDSLAWILRELIWTQVLKMRRVQTGGFSFGAGDLEGGEASIPEMEAALTQEIVDEIGLQLSAEAQQVLSETGAPEDMSPSEMDFSLTGGLSGLPAMVKVIRHKVEKLLENLELVDDATLVADWFLRKYIQDRNVILHTADGLTFAQPEEGSIRTALQELFSLADPGAYVWLADDQDRWLTIYPNGRATFQEPEGVSSSRLERVDQETAFELINLMKAGDLSAIRSRFM